MACAGLNWWRKIPPLRDSKSGRSRPACLQASSGPSVGCGSRKTSRCKLRSKNREKKKTTGLQDDWARGPRDDRTRRARSLRCPNRFWSRSPVVLCSCSLVVLQHLFACGPEFPNWLLDQGDEALLAAPIANFDGELDRIKLPQPKFRAVVATNDYLTQSTEADLADLRAALRKTGMPKD